MKKLLGKTLFYKELYPEGGVIAEIGVKQGRNANVMRNVIKPKEFWLTG